MDSKVEQEFLKAYDDLADALYRHCFFRVYSKEKAEELTQDTFMKVWEYLSSGKDIQNLRAFLYKVCNNLVIDYSRRKKEVSLESMLEAAPNLEPHDQSHERIENQVLVNEILADMENLPEESRELLILRYLDGFEPREIAEIVGLNVNNVSVKINRALNALKKISNQWYESR